ncbi:MAG TPA: hypothetical protein VI300_14320, partial [Solirubrobacter sp.]
MATGSRGEARSSALVDVLRAAGGKPLGVGELMQRAKLHPGERTEVKRALRDLTREGKLLRDGKRFSLPGARPAAAPERTGRQKAALRGGARTPLG